MTHILNPGAEALIKTVLHLSEPHIFDCSVAINFSQLFHSQYERAVRAAKQQQVYCLQTAKAFSSTAQVRARNNRKGFGPKCICRRKSRFCAMIS